MTTTAILSSSVLMSVTVSMWTGKAKLQVSDLPAGTTLPPEDLASLGVKRLTDPAALRPFTKVKTRVARLMSSYAVRFMGGWLIDPKYVPRVEAELADLKNEYTRASQVFLREYSTTLDAWCNDHAEWEQIIRHAAPDPEDIAGKFKMFWQTYQVQPAENTMGGDQLEQDTDMIVSDVVRQLAQDIAALYADTFADRKKTKFTPKTWRPLEELAEKCERVSLFNADATLVGSMLGALPALQTAGMDDSALAVMVSQVLTTMSDPATLQQMIDDWRTNQSLTEMFPATVQQPAAAPAQAPAPEQQPAPVVLPMTAPVMPVAPVAPAAPVAAAPAQQTGIASLQAMFANMF